ncbi:MULTISPECIES: DNA-formamidopyrimidine glycosylase [Acidobacterium]|uniref:Formamidopyrimidine-DNA glycosylase n=1 Tax=Acidobacterium capsulatum (strain ATCC 51196 / DSM 11244 / BCRC 80197 / JCM 7670 / NBRC 15755 / NCIMB 13165 / 161) TaxID=240015 RepID=C1FA67_ACIC5|nr:MULTISPECIES: DNA-formamidopyrimidine glycosylase [Acidobacterium]ACO32522.1 DNA-formamidopyrimidine glycosylase [Acidobacterium capsulatum ATCC 51196]HCT62302.1 bifunctional DNA-formamidopyrimidine glycosylase/DNA-(apurinic or apyrimidinic site) lyase [Acidobacterium sp.]
MPELPEVETVAQGVHERAHGQRILAAEFSRAREPFKTDPDTMAAVLTGQRIARVHRVGKHIVFDLETPRPPKGKAEPADHQWIVHLGMTGRLLYSAASVPVPPHTHGRLSLSSGHELRFVDARRFGRMGLHSGARAQPFSGPGSEPLHISPEDFAALFRGRKLSIKAALLNQKLLHGVGNIYADESLYWAGIRPTRIAGSLSRERLLKLHAALQQVLRKAIELGGSSVSDYVDADGVRGFFQLEHRVYDRAGEPCRACAAEIRKMVHAGRGTHYCPRCQR